MSKTESNLPHDDEGFLVGSEPYPVGRGASQMVADIAAIRADVHMVLSAVRAHKSSTTGTPPATHDGSPRSGRMAAPAPMATPAARVQRKEPALAFPQKREAPVTAMRRDKAMDVLAEAVLRDSRGRFVAKTKNQPVEKAAPGTPAIPEQPTPENREDRGPRIRSILSNSAGRVAGAAGALEEVDPTVKAFSEVAQPVQRGMEAIFGEKGDRQSNRWFRRIFGELKLFRREESTFNKVANKSLKNIEAKPGGEGEGGSGGMLGTMLAIIGAILARFLPGNVLPMLSKLPKLLSKIPLIGRLFKVGGGVATEVGAAGKVAAVAGESGRLAKIGGALAKATGFLKRLPVIGTALAALGTVAEVYAVDNDESLTDEQKTNAKRRAVGGLVGSLTGMQIGMAIGTAILPGLGTAIGGAIGLFLGEKGGSIIGERLSTWMQDIKAWLGIEKTPKTLAKVPTEPVKGEAPGRPRSSIGQAWNESGGAIVGAAKQSGVAPSTMAKIAMLESRFDSSADAQLKQFLETSGKKGSTASGLMQFTDGTWADSVSKFGSNHTETAALVPLAQQYRSDPRGVLAKRSDAQYKPLFDAKTQTVPGAIIGADALAGIRQEFMAADMASPSDADVYSRWLTGNTKAALANRSSPDRAASEIYSADAIKNNPGLFKGARTVADVHRNITKALSAGDKYAGESVIMSSMEPGRLAVGKISGVKTPGVVTPSAPPAVSVSPSVPSAPKMTAPVPAAEAPVVPVPLNSNDKPEPSVVILKQDPGQDVSNRAIAHVVSGGMSAP